MALAHMASAPRSGRRGSEMIRKAEGRFYETVLDDAVIVMNVESGSFHTLADTGLAIWGLIDGTRSQSEIVDKLSAEYDVDPEVCAREVADFIDQVIEAGFVQRD